jgi:hypothetical protein
MWVKFDEGMNELDERAVARWAAKIAGRVFRSLNATARTPPSAPNAERERLVPRDSGPVNEAFLQPTFEIPRQTHVSALAGELAVGAPGESITTLGAVHWLTRPEKSG